MSQKPKKTRPNFAPNAPRWVEKRMTLAENHGWRATPGYQVCVVGRGDIRFEYPAGWTVVPKEMSIKVHDVPFPDDTMVLEVSCIKTPPVHWTKFPPLEEILVKGMREHGREISDAAVRKIEIPGLYLVWAEYDDIDANTKKPVVWRQAHCRQSVPTGPGLLGVLTFGFYTEIYEKADKEWNHIAQSVVLGEYIADPTVGPRLN